MEGPFREVRIFAGRDYPASGNLQEDLLNAASTLERYLSWHYYVRYLNPRHELIAELRWTIRYRTGKPHDPELNILLDAASGLPDTRKVVTSIRVRWIESKNVGEKVAKGQSDGLKGR